MLKFFRKYQKGIFIVVAFMVIVSFTFLGTNRSNFQPAKEEKQTKVVGKAIDGSTIALCDIIELCRVLETDAYDPFIFEESNGINVLNDGVLKKDIFGTGIGKLMLMHYKEFFEESLVEKINRGKKFQFYKHPVAEMISQELVVNQFSPEVIGQMEKLKSIEDCFSEEALETYIDLYLSGMKVSPYLIRQFLLYQEKQAIPEQYWDQSLKGRSLALFNTKSATEWFGKEFIQHAAFLIYNADVYAKEKGIIITDAEVIASLMNNAEQWNKKIGGEETLSNDQLNGMIPVVAKRIGLSEKDMIKAWKKVLVFRRIVSEIEQSVLVDSFMCLEKDPQVNGYQLVKAQVYQLPEKLRHKNMKDLWKLQIYLDAVTKSNHLLDISDQYLGADEVAINFPELVQRQFSVGVVHVVKKDLIETIPLKEMWQWQLRDSNWKKLTAQFPELVNQHTMDQDSRYEYLENISLELRHRIDHFTRLEILEKSDDLVRKSLAQTALDKTVWQISLKRDSEVLSGIMDRTKLTSLLLAVGSEEACCSKIQDQLSCYTEDGENYYRIRVYEAEDRLEVLSYEEASSRGILDELFNKRIKVVYDYCKKYKDPIVLDQNAYLKEIHQVESALGEIAFKDLMEEIKAEQIAYNLSPDNYVPLRFFRYLKEQKKIASKAKNQQEDSLEMQFNLIDQLYEVSNQNEMLFSDAAMFKDQMEGYSKICINKHQEPYFYEILEKGVDNKMLSSEIEKRRIQLVEETERNFFVDFMQKIEIPKSL